jgi:hypothetical protein
MLRLTSETGELNRSLLSLHFVNYKVIIHYIDKEGKR